MRSSILFLVALAVAACTLLVSFRPVGRTQVETFVVPLAPTGWVAAGVVPRYTGTTPLSGVRLDLTGLSQFLDQYENRNVGQVGTGHFDSQFVHFEVSPDPLFNVVILAGTVGGGSVQLTQPGFDGSVDFAGTSGYSFLTTLRSDAVPAVVLPPTLGRRDWPVFIRAWGTSSNGGTGQSTTATTPFGGAEFRVTYLN